MIWHSNLSQENKGGQSMSVKFGFNKKISLCLIFVLIMLMMSFEMTGFASSNTNVALEKPTTCEGYTEGHEASLANDNSVGSYWESASCPTWWKVDLGDFYDINEIKIVSEVNKLNQQTGQDKDENKNNNFYQYTIYSSPDDIHWYKVAEKQDTEKANGSGETYQVYTTWARYLKVDMTYNSASTSVQIRDFRAYGEPSCSTGIGMGDGNLSETRINYPVTDGVTRTLITRGYQSNTNISTTTTGPWQVNVLTVDPETYNGRIQARLCGGKVSTTATVLDEAISQGAIAAINGSFFTVSPFDGTIGGSMGLFAVDGQVTNESINPRGAMLIPDGTINGIKIGRFTSTQTATSSDGSSITINGINRTPGVKVGVDANYAPIHDVQTMFTNEVVLYTDIFGKTTEKRFAGKIGWLPKYDNLGAEAIIGSDGIVKELYNEVGGHTIPEGGKVLAGIGTGADWVKAHATIGTSINADISLTYEGNPITLGPKASIISAGPCLIKNGEATSSEYWSEEGFKNASWIARNPRTLVGTKADGTLLMAVVDGRAPNISAGASLAECQSIMKALGATEVLNLDGGRSSMMTVADKIVSNIIENRKIGDILQLLP